MTIDIIIAVVSLFVVSVVINYCCLHKYNGLKPKGTTKHFLAVCGPVSMIPIIMVYFILQATGDI